ncbi:type II toxin-antitoxin system YafO family toxin [Thalassotalea euphylliae]|uniref:Type II toxin-antitoxin system YafO family toxin n=1 Tax=Thalassotalea euphylliae TaxID=1655234 RepID=A0A3E0TU91_9GAMM|nr:type II toxin-antitoxin system YafO family toxin [Thalassotalea euphylliae]REL28020.1 type II toxin-antitoxin system YafO family toxin [Thalassotalea euphylliae]
MIRVFKSKVISSTLSELELDNLVNDFKSYKLTGTAPQYLGRDVPYDHPGTLPTVLAEEVQHIHLGNQDNPLPLNKIQYHRTSDVHLVYCQGALDGNCYLLMAILAPDAHNQAKSRDIMFKLGTMAEKFRSRF